MADELYVFRGDHDPGAADLAALPVVDFSVTRPQMHFHKPYLCFTTNVTTPNPVGLIAPDLHRSVDIQQEWGKAFGRPARIPQAGIVVTGELRERSGLVERIAGAYAESLDWCNAHAVECGRLVAKHIDMLSPEAVADSIAAAPLQAVPAPKARAELEFLFGRLLDSNPALIGGRMPPDDFYAGVAVPAAAAANPAAAAVGQEAGTGR